MGVGDARNLVGAGDGDPLVWTPKAIAAEMSRVRGVLDTINKEMSQAVTDGKISGAEWSSWFDGTYTPAHKLVDSGSAWWGSDVTAARNHEQAALKWRDLIKSRGGKTIGPSDLGRKPDLISDKIKIAGLVVGGLVIYALLKHEL
jgi:hypothetical protein